jgi:hypothetical protein
MLRPGLSAAICPVRSLPRVVKISVVPISVGPCARSASTPDIHRVAESQSISRAHHINRTVDGGIGGEHLSHLSPSGRLISHAAPCEARWIGRTSPRLGHESGRGGCFGSVVARALGGEVLRRRNSGVALEVPDQVGLVGPSQLRRLIRPPHRPVDVDFLKQPAHPQDAGERSWAQTDLVGELSVKVTEAHPQPCSDVSNRTGRFRRELPDRSLAACDGVAVERFWRPEGGFDDIQGLHRCSACHQLVSQAGGPRPCLQQVHNTTPARARERAGSQAGGDDPDAERLALRLVDDRSVVRPDEEASVGDQRSALTDRGLPDGVAEDNCRDGRPGGSYTLADPLSYDHARTRSTRQSGWSHRRPGAARTRTRLDRTVFTV